MNGNEDQLPPMMDLICCIIAGFAGFGIAYAHKLRKNPDAFLTVLFFSTFLAVVTAALNGSALGLISVGVGVVFALSVVLVEWLMPLPKHPPSDEDEAS